MFLHSNAVCVCLCLFTYHLLTLGVETHQGGGKTGCQMHHKVNVAYKEAQALSECVCECICVCVWAGVFVLNSQLTSVAF